MDIDPELGKAYPRVAAYVISLGVPRYDVDRYVSEAAAVLEEKREKEEVKFEDLSALCSFLCGTALRKVWQSQSKYALEKERLAEYFNSKLAQFERHTRQATSDAEVLIDNEEVFELVRGAIRQLSDEDRRLIVLRFYQELTCDQIAAALKLTDRKVEGRLKRAVKRLRQILRNNYGDSFEDPPQ